MRTSVRGLHLGRGRPPRPDTLAQTGQISSHKRLADGAGHTFLCKRKEGRSGPSVAPPLCGAAPEDCSDPANIGRLAFRGVTQAETSGVPNEVTKRLRHAKESNHELH